jgi:hypothetical protein
MRREKVFLMIVLMIALTVMFISAVDAEGRIEIEKDLPMSEVGSLPTTLTIVIYDANTTLEVARQDYASGEWEADYEFMKYKVQVRVHKYRCTYKRHGLMGGDEI